MNSRGLILAAIIGVFSATSVLAQETGTSSTSTSGDPIRQPGGLYDATAQERKTQLSIWTGLGWWRGASVGVRYTLPLLSNGILQEINDSVELEVGGDFFLWFNQTTFSLPVEGRWTFHVLPNVSVYGKLSAGLELNFDAAGVHPWLLYDVNPGIIYRFSPSMVLRAEAGYRGLRLGIGFDF